MIFIMVWLSVFFHKSVRDSNISVSLQSDQLVLDSWLDGESPWANAGPLWKN